MKKHFLWVGIVERQDLLGKTEEKPGLAGGWWGGGGGGECGCPQQWWGTRLTVPGKQRTIWLLVGGCGGGFPFSPVPQTHASSTLPEWTQVLAHSRWLWNENDTTANNSHLSRQKRQPFILAAMTQFFWRPTGGWQIQTHRASHGKHGLLSASYSPRHQMLRVWWQTRRLQYTHVPPVICNQW